MVKVTLILCLTEMVLSTVTSSDLWTASPNDLYPSVFPLRDVVADSELTSVGKKGLLTSTDRATWSRLQASMLCEHKTNSRCKTIICKRHCYKSIYSSENGSLKTEAVS